MTEADGKIAYGQFIDLTDDYRDGFVDSLRLETDDDTRFAAARADRVKGNYTVMQNGVYTACEPCKDDPKKPPLWQIQAARIIHDNGEKMIYFEDARVEFFGVPLAYFPFMSSPDPSVTRKSGFLFPNITYGTAYGGGLRDPYFWALAPNYDLTASTMITTKEGALLKGIWRQRLMEGSYSIKAAGIFQTDPGYFAGRDGPNSPTANIFRGAIQTAGQFALSDKWVWGWTGLLMTDSQFLFDYQLGQFLGSFDPFHTGVAAEGVSQLYLTGVRRPQLFRHPVDLLLRLLGTGHPGSNSDHSPGARLFQRAGATGGGRRVQLQGQFDQPYPAAGRIRRHHPERRQITGCARPNNAANVNAANCLLRGIAGTYTRSSAEADWRRTFVTDNGMMITPFAGVRGDVAATEMQNQTGTSNFINPAEREVARAMPDVGVEYRYPFVDVEPWGTQTIEPIAQLVLRPNETQIGKFPNEDAQSMVFSDANLFSVDKFSGWDRVEGGGRVNAGFQYTAQVNRAGSFNVLFGQSYQIYGLNSFAATDLTNTGLQSGLDKAKSDYVGRVTYQPNQVYSFTARGRFDEATFTPQRLEFETRANFDRWTVQLMYGDYARAAGHRLFDAPRGNSGRRLGQSDAELGRARLGALRPGRQPIRPDPVRHRLHRRLPAGVLELHHLLYLYRHDTDAQQHIHAANEPENSRPGCVGADCFPILNFVARS